MQRILVAEDDTAVCELVARALTSFGYDVTTAHDGSEALDRFANGPFDLLVTDIVMPVMDGIALALKVSESYPNTRILMMTGFSVEKERAHNLDALVNDVLVKPFTLNQLRSAVDGALAEDSSLRRSRFS